MSYTKAHPFGYTPRKGYRSKDSNSNESRDKNNKQTVEIETTFKVARREKVWETDPKTGKRKMKLVPVLDNKGKPIYDTFHGKQTREVKHFSHS